MPPARPADGSAPFFQDLCNWQRIPEFEAFVYRSPAAEIAAREKAEREEAERIAAEKREAERVAEAARIAAEAPRKSLMDAVQYMQQRAAGKGRR